MQHDFKIRRHDKDYIPIFARKPNTFQMDTLIQSNLPPFLIFINVNSRKGYAYPMKNKSSTEVLRALVKHMNRVNSISELTSDEDSAYLSQEFQNYLLNHHINHHTTEENNHHILGIINRFIKTLRDLNDSRDFTPAIMTNILREYNKSPHSSINKSPNSFNSNDEINYVGKKLEQTDSILSDDRFTPGASVRILDDSKFQKKRLNYSKNLFKINAKDGYNYIVEAKDKSVLRFPKHMLMPDSRGAFAETLANDKKGVVEEIISYDAAHDKYRVRFEGGVTDTIPSKNLREGNPTNLSPLERKFWDKNKRNDNLPSKIKLHYR
jgi:hypothetical protein